jgi:hypothetical protein
MTGFGAGVERPARINASGVLPCGTRRHFSGLDERLHAHQIFVHLALRVSPEQRRYDMPAPPIAGL